VWFWSSWSVRGHYKVSHRSLTLPQSKSLLTYFKLIASCARRRELEDMQQYRHADSCTYLVHHNPEPSPSFDLLISRVNHRRPHFDVVHLTLFNLSPYCDALTSFPLLLSSLRSISPLHCQAASWNPTTSYAGSLALSSYSAWLTDATTYWQTVTCNVRRASKVSK